MDQTGLIYVLGFGFAATTFVFGTILFSWLITHRRARPQKGLPYESGIDTIGEGRHERMVVPWERIQGALAAKAAKAGVSRVQE